MNVMWKKVAKENRPRQRQKPLSFECQVELKSSVNISTYTQCAEELILNAVDAKASCISVRVDVSKYFIQVVDNGKGISQDEMGKLGKRHSTSKPLPHSITGEASGSLVYGHRGEALASIVNLSESVQIISRSASSSSSDTFSKTFKDGLSSGSVLKLSDSRPCCGTTVTVNDLFKKSPVRKKCTSESETLRELLHLLRCFGVSLAGHISMSLRDEKLGKVLMNTTHSKNTKEALLEVFGIDYCSALRSIRGSHSRMAIYGVMSTIAYTSKKLKLITLNGRIIKNSRIQQTIDSLLKNSLINVPNSSTKKKDSDKVVAKPKNYLYVVDLKCSYKIFCFNIHSDKTSVDFDDWKCVLDSIHMIVKKFLIMLNLHKGTEQAKNKSHSTACTVDPHNNSSSAAEALPINKPGGMSKGDGNSSICPTSPDHKSVRESTRIQQCSQKLTPPPNPEERWRLEERVTDEGHTGADSCHSAPHVIYWLNHHVPTEVPHLEEENLEGNPTQSSLLVNLPTTPEYLSTTIKSRSTLAARSDTTASSSRHQRLHNSISIPNDGTDQPSAFARCLDVSYRNKREKAAADVNSPTFSIFNLNSDFMENYKLQRGHYSDSRLLMRNIESRNMKTPEISQSLLKKCLSVPKTGKSEPSLSRSCYRSPVLPKPLNKEPQSSRLLNREALSSRCLANDPLSYKITHKLLQSREWNLHSALDREALNIGVAEDEVILAHRCLESKPLSHRHTDSNLLLTSENRTFKKQPFGQSTSVTKAFHAATRGSRKSTHSQPIHALNSPQFSKCVKESVLENFMYHFGETAGDSPPDCAKLFPGHQQPKAATADVSCELQTYQSSKRSDTRKVRMESGSHAVRFQSPTVNSKNPQSDFPQVFHPDLLQLSADEEDWLGKLNQSSTKRRKLSISGISFGLDQPPDKETTLSFLLGDCEKMPEHARENPYDVSNDQPHSEGLGGFPEFNGSLQNITNLYGQVSTNQEQQEMAIEIASTHRNQAGFCCSPDSNSSLSCFSVILLSSPTSSEINVHEDSSLTSNHSAPLSTNCSSGVTSVSINEPSNQDSHLNSKHATISVSPIRNKLAKTVSVDKSLLHYSVSSDKSVPVTNELVNELDTAEPKICKEHQNCSVTEQNASLPEHTTNSPPTPKSTQLSYCWSEISSKYFHDTSIITKDKNQSDWKATEYQKGNHSETLLSSFTSQELLNLATASQVGEATETGKTFTTVYMDKRTGNTITEIPCFQNRSVKCTTWPDIPYRYSNVKYKTSHTLPDFKSLVTFPDKRNFIAFNKELSAAITGSLNFSLSKDLLLRHRVIGQWDNKIILVRVDYNGGRDDLLLAIDQHAAHERVRLEMLEDQHVNLIDDKIVSSNLPQPIRLSLEFSDFISKAMSAKAARFGIELSYKEGSLYAQSVPSLVHQNCNTQYAKDFAVSVLTELQDYPNIQRPKAFTDCINSLSCRGAIKFGDELSLEECQSLIQKLIKCRLPFQCAHGRPSCVPVCNISHEFISKQRPGAIIQNTQLNFKRIKRFLADTAKDKGAI